MSADNKKKSMMMPKPDLDMRHSMLLYGDRYNRAQQDESTDFRKIPIKNATDSKDIRTTRYTYNSKYTKSTDKPYANLAKAIKD